MGNCILSIPCVLVVSGGIETDSQRGKVCRYYQPSVSSTCIGIEFLLTQFSDIISTPDFTDLAAEISLGGHGERVIGKG